MKLDKMVKSEEPRGSKQAQSLSSAARRVVYVVMSFHNNRKESIGGDNVKVKVFSSKDAARQYMHKRAKELYGDEEDHGEDSYFETGPDSIDFSDAEEGYRSSIEDFGFVKIIEKQVDDAAVTRD